MGENNGQGGFGGQPLAGLRDRLELPGHQAAVGVRAYKLLALHMPAYGLEDRGCVNESLLAFFLLEVP